MSPSDASGFVPSPRYFAKFKLLQQREGRAGCVGDNRSTARSARIKADYGVFLRAEVAHTGDVKRSGRTAHRVLHIDTGNGSRTHAVDVAALGVSRGGGIRQSAVKQAGVCN